MKSAARFALTASFAGLLASCGTVDTGFPPVPSGVTQRSAGVTGPAADYPVVLGPAYEIDGVTYTPEDVLSYDEVGYAGWYGEERDGDRTASGEIFKADNISGAHRTLPLPSYVEVTALNTGKTIVVRLNDRGPNSGDRLVDLSSGAARQLGIADEGVAAVRVRRVNPPEEERARIRSGGPAPERLETPEALLVALRRKLGNRPVPPTPVRQAAVAPPPADAGKTTAQPVASTRRSGQFIVENEAGSAPRAPTTAGKTPAADGNYAVQVAAFSTRSRAQALADKIGAKVETNADGSIWRVRYGPYESASAAQQGLELARKNGYGSARVLRSDSR